jgi:hypothetical protein
MDGDEATLAVWEALGTLTLAVHHLRGRITWLLTSGAVKFSGLAERHEFERQDRLIAELEEVLWEIVPPRAALLALRKYRLTGEMDDNVQDLLNADYRGRTPYDGPKAEQLREILKRLADVESFSGGEIVRD